MRVHTHVIESEPFAENTYVVWADGAAEAVVVDPGFDPAAILAFLSEKKLSPVAILLTHGHVDHIAGVAELKSAFPAAPVVIGRGDAPMLLDPMLNLSGLWGFDVTSPPADRLLDDGDRVQFAGVAWDVREIPGHSPGHVVYVGRDTDPPLTLSGDVLFAGSVGRTDFPGGSSPQLLAGIRAKLWPLADETRVLPGHGPATTIGAEKRTNPYCGDC